MSMKFVLVISWCFFVITNADNSTIDQNARIIGGSGCGRLERRFVVLISTWNLKKRCTGTILNDRWVLTTKNCPTEKMFVFVGFTGFDKNFKNFFVTSIAGIYPYGKKDDGKNNIALLLLATRVPNDRSYVRFVKLPSRVLSDDIYKDCPKVLAMGWGKKDLMDRLDSDTLQCAYLPVISNEECLKMFSGTNKVILPDNFCTLSKTKDHCAEDFGGPVMCGDKQIGIISWGFKCGYGFPGTVTRTDNYFQFIMMTIRKTSISGTSTFSVADSLILFIMILFTSLKIIIFE